MQARYQLDGVDASDPGVFDELVALIATIQTYDEHPDPSDASDLRELIDRPYFDKAHDLVAVRDGTSMIGWSAASHRPSTERFVGVNLRGGVHPDHRERGVGSALLDWGDARARTKLADSDPSLPRWIVADALETQSKLRRLLGRHGFEEQRWFVDMKRPLDDVPEPQQPDGITIVPWADRYADQVRRVHAAAFGDHWGSIPFDEASWKSLLADEGTQLDLSFVALDGDTVVGYSFNEAWPPDEDDDERIAWVGSLGTLRDYRRRGIAGSLLDHSHARFKQAGFTHAMLDVDADSPTNAGSIYQAHGYVEVYREVVAVKEYDAAS